MEKYHLSQFQVGEILIQTTSHHKSHDGVFPSFYQLLTKYTVYSYIFYFSFNYNFSLQMHNSVFLIQGNSEGHTQKRVIFRGIYAGTFHYSQTGT